MAARKDRTNKQRVEDRGDNLSAESSSPTAATNDEITGGSQARQSDLGPDVATTNEQNSREVY
ncbi:MAG TPA: hypothetical protein VNN73_09780 [Blastocatellia bacterium]|nr:hypothetical protein [Blastocatellia bacterium]